MEITGKLIQVLPTEQGTSGSGSPWKKTVAVFDIGGKFNDKLAVEFFNSDPPKTIGNQYSLQLNLKSREFNGKWYSNISCWKYSSIEGGVAENNSSSTQRNVITPSQTMTIPKQGVQNSSQSFEADDTGLPF